VARERDAEPWAVYSRHSGCGTASAWECPTHTVQACSQMHQSAGRFQYDGVIPKPHSGNNHLYGRLSGHVSQDEGYLLGVSSN